MAVLFVDIFVGDPQEQAVCSCQNWPRPTILLF